VFNLTKKSTAKYEFDTLRLSEFEDTFTEQTLEENFSAIYSLGESVFGSTRNLISFKYGEALGYALKDNDSKKLSIHKVGSDNVINISYDNKDVAKILFEEGFLFVCYINENSYTVVKYTENGEIVAENDFTVTPSIYNDDIVYTDIGTVFFYSGGSLVIKNEKPMGGSAADGGVALESASGAASFLKISLDNLNLIDEYAESYLTSSIGQYFRMYSTQNLMVNGETIGVSYIGSGSYYSSIFYNFSEDFSEIQKGRITHYYTDEEATGLGAPYDSAVSDTGVFCSVGTATQSLTNISGYKTQNVYAQLSNVGEDVSDKESFVVNNERTGKWRKSDVTDYGMIWLTDIKENYEEISTVRVVYYKGLFVVLYEIGLLGDDAVGRLSTGEIVNRGELHSFKTYYQVIDLNGNVIKGETLLGEGSMFGQYSNFEELPIFVTEQGIQWIGNKIHGVVLNLGYDPELEVGEYNIYAENELTLYTLSFEDLTQDTKKDIRKNEYEKIYGDCTEDGVVNIADLVYMHKVFLYSTTYIRSCDLDGDGYLTVLDYAYMKRTLIKKVYAGGSIQ
jgi:hypothetical protein